MSKKDFINSFFNKKYILNSEDRQLRSAIDYFFKKRNEILQNKENPESLYLLNKVRSRIYSLENSPQKKLKIEKGNFLLKMAIAFIIFLLIFLPSLYLFNQHINEQEINSRLLISQKGFGIATFVAGDVYILKAGGRRTKLKAGLKIIQNDIIKTEKKSICDIQLKDNSLIRLKSNTELKFNKLIITKFRKNTKIGLVSGSALIKPVKLLKNSSFNIITPSAVCGVRGTEFKVSIKNNNRTCIAVKEGKVSVRPRIKIIDDNTISSLNPNLKKQIKNTIDKNSIILDKEKSIEITRDKNLEESVEEFANAINKKIRDKKYQKNKELLTDDFNKIEKVISDYKPTISNIDLDDLTEFNEIQKIEINKKHSTLKISIEPADAKLYVNNIKYSIDKFSRTFPQKTRCFIKIVKEGFIPYEKELIIDNEAIDLKISLEPKQKDLEKISKKEKNIKNKHIFYRKVIKLSSIFEMKPIVKNNIIYLNTKKGDIYAISINGTLIWKHKLPNMAEGYLTISGNTIFIGCNDNNIYALDLNGNVKWAKPMGSMLFSSPVIRNNTIYVGTTDGKIAALDISGNVKWVFKAESTIGATLSIDQKHVYASSEDNNIYAINRDNGSLKWKFKANNRIIGSSPVIQKKAIYFGDYSGTLYAVSIDGKELWRYNTGSRIVQSPIVSDNKVFVINNQGWIYAFSSGKKLWSREINVNKNISPTYFNGYIYIGTKDNTLIKLNAKTGEQSIDYRTDKGISSTIYISDNYKIFGMNNSSLAIISKEIK